MFCYTNLTSSRLVFTGENDGFPLPSTDDEVRHFDEEVFVGSEVPRVEIMPSPRCHRSRSGSVPEFRTMSCAVLKAKLQKVSGKLSVLLSSKIVNKNNLFFALKKYY